MLSTWQLPPVSELELKPLVLCRDPQGTAMLSQAKGNLPFDVKPSYPEGAAKYDLVIADHVASDWEVPPAPTVIIPTKPVRTDYATFCDALTRLEKAGKWIIPSGDRWKHGAAGRAGNDSGDEKGRGL